MAQLKDLLVSGVARFLNTVKAPLFKGDLEGNADTATTATKLDTNAGSATQPVYFSGGKPVATTYTLGKSVPSDAKFTDTTYTHPSYTAKSSGLYKITVDSTGHVSATAAVAKADITGLGIPAQDTTYNDATTSARGLMTAAMVTKLNGIAEGANKYTHPTTSGNKHIPSGGSSGQILRWSADGTAEWGADNNTDTKVTMTVSSTNANYPLLLGPSGQAGTTTTTSYFGTKFQANPSTGALTATTFKGALDGNAGTAAKLQTARKISLGTGAVGTATSFDGSGDITIPVTSVKEAYLSWGGRNFNGSFGPIDAAMIPDLGANRLAYGKAAGITIEYSRDGGATWTDYGATNDAKVGLFSVGGGFTIGKSASSNVANANCLLRVDIKSSSFGLYTTLSKFAIYVSTNGSQGCYCTIQAAKKGTPTVFTTVADTVGVSGWSGWNIINVGGVTFGNNTDDQYATIRFIFGCTSHTSTNYAGLNVSRIMGFGGVGWAVPSNMAKYGTLYAPDVNQNATFPAKVIATAGGFTGNLTGNADTATTASKLGTNAGSATQPVYFANGVPVATTYTLGKSVPADAKFTDTTYGTGTVYSFEGMQKNVVTKTANVTSSSGIAIVDGTNITSYTASTDIVELYMNGIRLTQGTDYVISSNTIYAASGTTLGYNSAQEPLGNRFEIVVLKRKAVTVRI